MPFPVVKRYFLNFRNSDTGLAPIFTFFQRADTFGATSPASPVGGIVEKSNGEYYFDWTWTTKNDPDIVFMVDGGASIPTEEVRYIKGAISPRDAFLDEPISQIVTDVWSDSTAYAAGQKGLRVDQLGDPTDNSAAATVFGKALLYKESIRGDTAGNNDGKSGQAVFNEVLTVAGDVWEELLAGHLGAGKAGQALFDASNLTIDNAAIATAVWDKSISGYNTAGQAGTQLNVAANHPALVDLIYDEPTAGHASAGTFGKMFSDSLAHALAARKVAFGKWKIESFQLTLYDVDGLTPIQVFDLRDDNDNPTNTKVYRRNPTLPVVPP
jgi:hypothetical protein